MNTPAIAAQKTRDQHDDPHRLRGMDPVRDEYARRHRGNHQQRTVDRRPFRMVLGLTHASISRQPVRPRRNSGSSFCAELVLLDW